MIRRQGTDTQEHRHASASLDLGVNALAVLRKRYLERDETGEVVETPEGLFRRVARAVASAESRFGLAPDAQQELESAFFDLLADRRFLPNSPTLMNAGRRLGMLSACFVLPLEDSIPDIMETARQIALVQRAGGGTGIDLSRLRPAGSIVRSSGGTTEGPLSFLEMLSAVTDAIQQGAFRRGANMGMMRIDHPDILAFVDLKSDLARVTNYNLSVSMTDAFLERLRESPDAPHEVVAPHTGERGHLRRDGGKFEPGARRTGVEYSTVREVWEGIVRRAWETGEPGLIFIDEVNRANPTPHVFEIRATNPCGEQPLGPYEACNLGSIQLERFYRDIPRGGVSEQIDWTALEATVRTSVRFLDDVVEANRYPSPEIHEATHANRKIGLGVMGFADLLFRLGIRYDSEEALDLARRIGAFLQAKSRDASHRLALERGPFPNWKGSVWEREHGLAMRNAHTTTIAPTGTISIIAGCSGGIEPVFSLAFTRQVMEGARLREVNPIFRAAIEAAQGDPSRVEAVLAHAARTGSIQDLEELPDSIRGVFRTARDIAPEWHVRMQAAWQEHTDAAVSKTINLPAGADPADVERAYLLAHELRCKGITVYRDGSRPVQPMALDRAAASDEASAAADASPAPIGPAPLPEIIPCVRVRQLTPFGNMHVKISVDPRAETEREVFAQLGKGGDLANSDLEAICRLLSLFLRCNGELELALGQLEGIGSSLSVPTRDGRIRSLADGLAHAIRKYLRAKVRFGLEALLLGKVDPAELVASARSAQEEPRSAGRQPPGASSDSEGDGERFQIRCPECTGVLAFEEGCAKCHACGFAQC